MPKKTLDIVLAQGSDIIVQVKANQAQLLEAVEAIAQDEPCHSQARQFDHKRSRIERRQVSVYLAATLGELLDEPNGWPSRITSVVKVYRDTDRFDTRLKDWCRSTETAYYISTADPSASLFAEAIRGHWGIENRNHYVRDVTLKEDASRIRRKPGIMARLRSFALNILRKNNVTNVSEALYDNALCLKNLWQYAGIF